MFKSKGLVIEWPTPRHDMPVDMTIWHSSPSISAYVTQAMRVQRGKVYNKICKVVHEEKHKWVGVINTEVSHRCKDGSKNHFETEHCIKYTGRLMSDDMQGKIEEVQREQAAVGSDQFEARSITFYCKD